jgi:GTP pyrophosphokinase
VHTGRARSKIKSALKDQRRMVAAEGKELLQRKMKSLKLEFTPDNVGILVKHFGRTVASDLYYAIATKQVDVSEIKDLRSSKGKLELPQPKPAPVDEADVDPGLATHVRKGDELLIFDESAKQIKYQIAPCCNPIAGDDVFGFVTSKGEIKIHRTNCPNAESLLSNYGYRVVRTKWTSQEELAFLTGLRITGLDDVGVMQRITNVISGEMQVNIRSISVDSGDGVFEGKLAVYVKNKEHLENLIKRLKKLEGIYTVTRLDN